ncbi:hypothetical protein N0V90_007096 [Kalmusia sp. IMI 367209]|nr:hypothetical protein N0V90_007096 [Kalmusia sp. IMI 367209]
MKHALAFLSAIASVHALGRAIVTNQCDDDLYLYSSSGAQITLSKDVSYSEIYAPTPSTLTLTPIQNSTWQTILTYHIANASVAWSLSDVGGGDAFAGRKITVKPSDAACEEVVWAYGKPPPAPGAGEKVCGEESDLEI